MRMAPNVRGAPVLVVYPPRPGRSYFSLHRTGMMVMIQGLRGRKPSHGLFYWHAFPSGLAAGRIGMLDLLSGLFFVLYPGLNAPELRRCTSR